MIPRRRLWCLKLWILNLSSLSPILEALLLEINLIKENKPKYNIMLMMISPIPSSKSPRALSSFLIITLVRSKGRRSLFWDLILMWERPMKSSDYWIGFFLFGNVPTRRLRFVFTTISANVWPTPSVRKDEAYFKSMAPEVSDFLKGQG